MSTPCEWEVERAEFWADQGSTIAFRNLLISIPCLLFAFAIWLPAELGMRVTEDDRGYKKKRRSPRDGSGTSA